MNKAALILLAVSGVALAQVRPSASGPDPMHQSVAFADGQTVILEASPGFQLTVELGQGERIKSAVAGDAGSWQVAAPDGASQFFVRPNPGAQPTNLTVISSRHSYYFLLIPAPAMTASNALSVRFSYPQVPIAAAVATEAPKTDSGSYKLSGSSLIRPSLIWDDGRKTYLDWPDEIEAPAVFSVDGAGHESLVNSQWRDGRFVIDAVYPRLLFRLDRLTARADRKAARS